MFVNDGTLNFANEIITIDHIDLIISGINAHLMIHVFCKFGNDIQRNKATVMILVKETKTVINVWPLTYSNSWQIKYYQENKSHVVPMRATIH